MIDGDAGETAFERDVKAHAAKNNLPAPTTEGLSTAIKSRIGAIQRDRRISGSAAIGEAHPELMTLRKRLKSMSGAPSGGAMPGYAKGKSEVKKMASKVRGYADGASDVGETEWDREENNAQLSHRIPISEANSQAFQDAAKAKLQKMGGGVSGYAKGTSKVPSKPRESKVDKVVNRLFKK